MQKTLWSLWIAIGIAVSGGDLPPLRIPHGVGVNIHFMRGHERDLDMIAAAGIRVVRMDLGWAGIERQKGQYDWAACDELTANLEKRGLRPYYILDYSNELYEETVASVNPVTGKEQRDVASPQRPESVAAFAKWAAAEASRYRGRGVIWEIWNEPNITFWKPKPDVEQYTALVLAACRSIRSADPAAIVVGPATSELPIPFLEKFFAAGVLEFLDAVSVHPYRSYSRPPETALPEYAKLRELIGRFAPPGKSSMPILSGEWGYATHAKGVPLETQADYVVRQQLSNLAAGVPVSIWYDWKNDGPDPAEREHNFGLVTSTLDPKPAYLALRTMTQELNGCRFVRRFAPPADGIELLLMEDESGRQTLAAWTLKESRTVQFPVSIESEAGIVITNWKGEKTKQKIEAKLIQISLSPSPQFVALTNAKFD